MNQKKINLLASMNIFFLVLLVKLSPVLLTKHENILPINWMLNTDSVLNSREIYQKNVPLQIQDNYKSEKDFGKLLNDLEKNSNNNDEKFQRLVDNFIYSKFKAKYCLFASLSKRLCRFNGLK